jgi:hypothetical protein
VLLCSRNESTNPVVLNDDSSKSHSVGKDSNGFVPPRRDESVARNLGENL